MKRSWIVALALIGAAALVGLGIAIGRAGGGHPNKGVTASGAAAGAGKEEETVWTCSMHPQVRQAQPGQCPICGMDLIRLLDEQDEGIPGGQITVSEEAAALMEVRTWPVERRPVERKIDLFGHITYDETRLRVIAAWAPGRIERLHVDFTGAPVERGAPMVDLFSPPLISAQEELLQALHTSALSTPGHDSLVEAARDRLRVLGLSDEQVRAIEEAGKAAKQLTIPSPLSGIVIERHAREGAYVDTGNPIYSVADLSRLWVELEAYERDLPWLRVGQRVAFETPAFPGETFLGEVEFIDPTVSRINRTAPVRVGLPNPDGRLKPGMFVNGTVQAPIGGEENSPKIVVPATAALITGERSLVYVKVPRAARPTYEPREVVLGPRAGDYYVVESGLDEGELVVTHGNFKIDSELQIRGLPSMMAPEAAESADHGHGEHEMTMPAGQDFTAAIGSRVSGEIASLIYGYIDVATGLAKDDLEAAHRGLATMRERLEAVEQDHMPEAARAAWHERRESLDTILSSIPATAGLEQIREALPELTREVERIHAGFGGSVELHRAYCPMARNNRGAAWLQTLGEINNPYFGASMLRCGEIVGRVNPDSTTD